MTRAMPCATCAHPKTAHRIGRCERIWKRRGATFMGISTVVEYCRCRGYEPRPIRVVPVEVTYDEGVWIAPVNPHPTLPIEEKP